MHNFRLYLVFESIVIRVIILAVTTKLFSSVGQSHLCGGLAPGKNWTDHLTFLKTVQTQEQKRNIKVDDWIDQYNALHHNADYVKEVTLPDSQQGFGAARKR